MEKRRTAGLVAACAAALMATAVANGADAQRGGYVDPYGGPAYGPVYPYPDQGYPYPDPRYAPRFVPRSGPVVVVHPPAVRQPYVDPRVYDRRRGSEWTDGGWRWDGQRWVWDDGRWARDPGGGRTIEARWVQRNGRWVLIPAHGEDWRRWDRY